MRGRATKGVSLLRRGLSWAIATCLMAAASVAADDQPLLGPNLVGNPSFEQGATAPADWHWSVSRDARATAAISAQTAHGGVQSVLFHSESASAPHVYGGLSQTIGTIRPGSRYMISLWARGGRVGHCWFGGGPGWALRRQLPQGDFDWQRIETHWTAPADARSFELRINIDSETAALFVDDIEMREIDPVELRPRSFIVPLDEAAARGYLPLARLDPAPVVDANLADWPDAAPPLRIPAQVGRAHLEHYQGEADLSLAMRTAWDEKCLYLSLDVTDDVHVVTRGVSNWVNDSIQVAFDPLLERSVGLYGPHDSEYGFALSEDGAVQVDCWHASRSLGDRSVEMECAARRTETHTLYEIAIPWAAIGVPAGTSPVFGFSVLVNDNDGSGREGYVELTPGIGRSKDPSAFAVALDASVGSLALMPRSRKHYMDGAIEIGALAVMPDPMPPGYTWTLVARRGERSVPLLAAPLEAGPGGLLVLEARPDAAGLGPGEWVLDAHITDGAAELATAHTRISVSDLKQRVERRVEALRPALAEALALAERAESLHIPTDYPRVQLTAGELFLDFALDDLHNGRPERAEYVAACIEKAVSEADSRLRAALRGEQSPPGVPRYVTSPVELRGMAFWADTVVPATGRRERRPVFFNGYGHFGRVVRDMELFPRLGANIIQIEIGPNSTQPDESTVTAEPVANYIGAALEKAAAQNVMVCWLASPHYFPGWAMQKWPELGTGGGGFFHYTVDAPQAREIVYRHLLTSMGEIGGAPALHSVCLSNEPVYTDWEDDPFRLALWHEYLRRQYGTAAEMNEACGTEYASFDDVPVLPTGTIPDEAQMTPLRYQQLRFNMAQFSEFHQRMSDMVHAAAPGTWTHAKVMPVVSGRANLAWGCDPEQFAYAGDVNGNDCWNIFGDFGDRHASSWIVQSLYYDVQRSARRRPVVNSENHLITDGEQRLIPPEHTDCALWQGALHGMGASMIWVWERTYTRTSSFEGSILHRPDHVIAVGNVGLDLMRLGPEVARLQRARAPAAILYSMTSQLWSERARRATVRAYEALNQTGWPADFVTERQVTRGELRRYRALICPASRHLPDEVCAAVGEYSRGAGEVWLIDAECFAMDEHARQREQLLRPTPECVWSPDLTARQLRDEMLAAMDDADLRRAVVLSDGQGREPWGIEYRSTLDGRDVLLAVVNYWGLPQTLRIAVDGRPARGITDLRALRDIAGAQLTLQPLQATVLRVRR